MIRERTVVFNGDILTDLDLKAVIREHNERKATATIVLQPVANPSAYGLVETETDGRVHRFLEKPKEDEITCNNINAGTYILEPNVLDFVPVGENYSFEYGLFPDLLKRKEAFYAHVPPRTYWIDIGTPERYLEAHQDLLANRVQRIHIKERRGSFDSATVAEIDELSIIGDDCQIKPGAQIVNSVLGAGLFCGRASACRELSSVAAHADWHGRHRYRRNRRPRLPRWAFSRGWRRFSFR